MYFSLVHKIFAQIPMNYVKKSLPYMAEMVTRFASLQFCS